jgi:hypothetical protein
MEGVLAGFWLFCWVIGWFQRMGMGVEMGTD